MNPIPPTPPAEAPPPRPPDKRKALTSQQMKTILESFLTLQTLDEKTIASFNAIKKKVENTQDNELKTLLKKVENKFKVIILGSELDTCGPPPPPRKTTSLQEPPPPSKEGDYDLIGTPNLPESIYAPMMAPEESTVPEILKRAPPPPPPRKTPDAPPQKSSPAPVQKPGPNPAEQRELEVNKHYMAAIEKLFDYCKSTKGLKKFMGKVTAGKGLRALMKGSKIEDTAVREEVTQRLQNAINGIKAINRILPPLGEQHHRITARPTAYGNLSPLDREKAYFDSQELLLDLFKVAGSEYHLFVKTDSRLGTSFAISKANKIEGYTNIPRTDNEDNDFEKNRPVNAFRNRCKAYRASL